MPAFNAGGWDEPNWRWPNYTVLRAAMCEEDAVSRGWWAGRWGRITSTDAGSQMSNVHYSTDTTLSVQHI